MLDRSFRPGSNLGKSSPRRAPMSSKKPGELLLVSSKRARAFFRLTFLISISPNALILPSRTWSNIWVCSADSNPNSAMSALIKPACDSFTLRGPIPSSSSTSEASSTSSISARGWLVPISSTPHCHRSLCSFPVPSKIKVFPT